MSQETFKARVISARGHHNLIETPDQVILEARRKGKKKDLVAGDIAVCRMSSGDQALIESIEPRRNLLYRSDALRVKALAANVDQVALVFATRPAYNRQFIWKSLLAADAASIPLLVIRNKTDYTDDESEVRPFIEELKRLGAQVVEISATHHPEQAKETLEPLFAGKITLLIGQSGMGKSTILNLLVDEAKQRTQEYSKALNLGKQTTTATRWFNYGSGALIDTPGFQEFGLAHLTAEDIARGMPEIREHAGHCRFANCRHLKEPNCSVKAALEAGEISPERYAFYCSLMENLGR